MHPLIPRDPRARAVRVSHLVAVVELLVEPTPKDVQEALRVADDLGLRGELAAQFRPIAHPHRRLPIRRLARLGPRALRAEAIRAVGEHDHEEEAAERVARDGGAAPRGPAEVDPIRPLLRLARLLLRLVVDLVVWADGKHLEPPVLVAVDGDAALVRRHVEDVEARTALPGPLGRTHLPLGRVDPRPARAHAQAFGRGRRISPDVSLQGLGGRHGALEGDTRLHRVRVLLGGEPEGREPAEHGAAARTTKKTSA